MFPLRDDTIAWDGKWRLASVNDVMHRKRAEDFGRFWKSQLVEMRPASGEDSWFSLAHVDLCGRCHTCWAGWGRWKSENRKIVPLSLYVEKPLNLKVIKSFVPEQRSRYVFFEFRDSYVLSLWTFYVRFTHSHMMAMVQYQQDGPSRTRHVSGYGSQPRLPGLGAGEALHSRHTAKTDIPRAWRDRLPRL